MDGFPQLIKLVLLQIRRQDLVLQLDRPLRLSDEVRLLELDLLLLFDHLSGRLLLGLGCRALAHLKRFRDDAVKVRLYKLRWFIANDFSSKVNLINVLNKLSILLYTFNYKHSFKDASFIQVYFNYIMLQ